MSLATRCPACGTVFRVVQDQLKVSQGWVRCGQCHEVFNALESLFDLDTSPTPPPAPAPASSDPPPAPQAPAFAATEPSTLDEPPAPGPRSEPAREVRRPAPAAAATTAAPPTTPASHLPAPKPAASPAPAPTPEPAPQPSPAPEPPPPVAPTPAPEPVDTPVAPPPPAGYELPGDGDQDGLDAPDTDALAAPFGASRLPESWEREALKPEEADRPPSEEVMPRFLQQAEQQARRARRTRRALLLCLCGLLLVLLGGQLTLQGRDLLAAHWPASRPYLASLCSAMGCEVGAPMALDQIVLDSSQLQTTDVPGELTITAELRNRASWPVRRPSVELTLTSDDGLTLARRVLSPSDLGATDTTLPGEGNWHAQVRLDVAPLKVTGYALEVFYP